MSNEFFFANVRLLEERRSQLRSEEARVAVRAKRRSVDVEDLRRRWYLSEDEGGLDVSRKRAYIREAVHAVIVHPAKVGRAKYNPDLLEPIWRET